MPVFHDPRPAKLMTQLPLRNEKEITLRNTSNTLQTKTRYNDIYSQRIWTHEYVVDAWTVEAISDLYILIYKL
jgi:hypothetical protein